MSMLRALRQEDNPYTKIQAFPGQRKLKLERLAVLYSFADKWKMGERKKLSYQNLML